jgi:hypothetical protein
MTSATRVMKLCLMERKMILGKDEVAFMTGQIGFFCCGSPFGEQAPGSVKNVSMASAGFCSGRVTAHPFSEGR